MLHEHDGRLLSFFSLDCIMISFLPTDEQQIAVDAAKALAMQAIRPISRDVEMGGAALLSSLSELSKIGIVQAMADAALSGGEAVPRILTSMVLEEIAWADVNTAFAFASAMGFVRAVADFGSEEAKHALLPAFCDEVFKPAAFATAEKTLGARFDRPRTSLVGSGSTLRLHGAKSLVARAGDCDHYLVSCVQGDAFRLVVVPASAPGVEIVGKCDTMGLTAQGFSDVSFSDVEIDDRMVLTLSGRPDLEKFVSGAWIASSAILTGICRAVYEHSTEYTKMRSAHGSALARKQAVALRLVDMFIDVEAMRWMTWRASSNVDAGNSSIRSARLAWHHAVKKANWITDEGVQLMGGHGFIADNPVEAWYRNSKSVAVLSQSNGV